MKNINVKLKNASGDVLYPKTLWSNIEGKPSIFWEESGSGQFTMTLTPPNLGVCYGVLYFPNATAQDYFDIPNFTHIQLPTGPGVVIIELKRLDPRWAAELNVWQNSFQGATQIIKDQTYDSSEKINCTGTVQDGYNVEVHRVGVMPY